ncbi:MAG: hypothetical protein HC879_18930 [Leptolyngbyaceae cyanobacterium SL_5_9]|nr:hypothetical protein [Leptolyngbyaceae cyanobacterium SL_5_9]
MVNFYHKSFTEECELINLWGGYLTYLDGQAADPTKYTMHSISNPTPFLVKD